jgi:hypothetical protein
MEDNGGVLDMMDLTDYEVKEVPPRHGHIQR